MAQAQYRKTIDTVISNYILPLGMLIFLTGILFFRSYSAYHTQIYLFLIVPTLILLINNSGLYRPILKSRAFQILLLLLVYVLLSLLWNDPAISDLKYLKRPLLILLFILSMLAIGKDRPDKMVMLLIIAAAIYSLAAYYSFYTDYVVKNMTLSERIIGIGNLHNPLLSSHIYGIFAALLLTYFFAVERNWKKDIVLILMFIGILAFIILTQSRTPLVGLSSVLLLLLWMHRNKLILYFVLLMCILAMIFFSFNYEMLIQRGLSYRPEIWAITFEKIAMNPFFGSGLGTDIFIYIDDLKTMFTDTHNFHIGLTYHFGIFGLGIWLIFLASLFVIYIKNKTLLSAQVGIVLLAYGMSAGLTEGTSFFVRPKEVWFLTWLPIALLFTAEFKRLNSTKQSKTIEKQ